jgi:hypothetical protein
MRRVNPTSAPPSLQTVSIAPLTGLERCGRLEAIWAGDASPAWFSAARHVGSPPAVPLPAFSARKRPPSAQAVSIVTLTRLERCGKLEVTGQVRLLLLRSLGHGSQKGSRSRVSRGASERRSKACVARSCWVTGVRGAVSFDTYRATRGAVYGRGVVDQSGRTAGDDLVSAGLRPSVSPAPARFTSRRMPNC